MPHTAVNAASVSARRLASSALSAVCGLTGRYWPCPSFLSMPSSTNRETVRLIRLGVVPRVSAISAVVRSDLVR